MLRHLVVFLFVVVATAALIGCGGREDERRKGSTDPRIIGEWLARELTFNETTQPCPTEIAVDDDRVSCSADPITFREDGTYTVGGTTDDYYFDGSSLVMYNRAGNAAVFGLTFDGATNVLTWTWNQNGRPATLVTDRILVE